MDKQYVLFQLEKNEFGIPIEEVQEIILTPPITKLPQTPFFLKGIINLRNKVIPVINLNEKLGLESFTKDDTRIIVVNMDGIVVGMIVDMVVGVKIVQENSIEKNMEQFINQSNILKGISRIKESLILLLNLPEIIEQAGVADLNLAMEGLQ